MQQVAQAPAEVVLLRPGLGHQQAGVAPQRRPAAAALARTAAVHVLQLERLIVQEVGQPHGVALQRGIGLQLGSQTAPVLRRQCPQALQHLLTRLALQMDVAARRQAAEALRHAVHQFAARQAGQAGQQAVEAEIGAVLADEVQHQAALLAWCQAQPAADLLLEQHRALRGPQQQQRVDHRQVDALVVEVDSHQRAQFAALQPLRRAAAFVGIGAAHHAGGGQARAVEPVGHELRMRHRHAEHDGPAACGIRRQPPPFVDHQAGAHVVGRHQLVQRIALAGLVPGHGREVGGVVAGVVLERRQQLQVQRMPQAQLHRRAAVGPGIEVRGDGLAVTALGGGGQAQQQTGAHGTREGVEPVGRQAVALVHHHGVPMVGAHAGHQVAAGDAVDGGEEVVEALRLVAAGQQLAELGVAQHLAVGAQRLTQDLLAVRNEQQARPPAFGLAGAAVVEGGHNCLASPGGGHQQVARAATGTFGSQLLQHLLLVGLGLQVEEADRRRRFAAERLAAQRGGQRLAVRWIVRVVALEFTVGPQGFEVGNGPCKQRLLPALRQLHRPFQPAGQRCARQVGAAHIGRAETGLAVEQPGLGMQPCAPAVQRHTHLTAGQARQVVQRTCLGGAGVGGRQDAQPRGRPALRAQRGHLLQHVLQLAHARHGDEADQDVHLVAGRQLAPDLLQQRRRPLAGGEQPGHGQTDLRRYRKLPAALHRTQHAQRRRQQVDHIGHGAVCVAGAVRLQPAAQHDKQLVHQRQLLPGLVGSIAWQVVEQGRQLPVQGLGQRLARRRVQRCHIGTVGTDRGQGPGQAVGQQLVVQAVGECHRGTAGVLARVTRSIGLAIVGAGRLARFVPGCHAPPLAGGLPFAIRLQQLLTATVTPLRDNRP